MQPGNPGAGAETLMPGAEKDVAERVRRALKKGMVESLTRELVAIPSHSGVPTREKEAAEFLHEYLVDNGVSSKLRNVEKGRPNVIATVKGTTGGGKNLMLNGHLDTVPAYAMDIPPFTPKLKAGKLYGRGTLDMKGGLAAMACALVAIEKAKVRLQSDLVLAAVVGEEERSEGTEDIVVRGPKTDLAIVGEPTNLEIQPSHRGLEWLEVHIFGKAAHGGQADKGVNAISMAAKFIDSVESDLLPRLAARKSEHTLPPTLNMGVIEGGQQPSSVADHCIVRLDRRWIPEESLEQVFQEIYDVFDTVKRAHPQFRAKLKRDPRNMKTMTHVPNVVSRNHVLVKAIGRSVRKETGRAPKLTSFWGWTDAALLTHFAKIPTVLFGPGGGGAHARTEFVKVSDLTTCANVYSDVALDMCNLD
jgi:acetylornithine deacetylase/succinyl-diaminopimelate desuccinylase family protein